MTRSKSVYILIITGVLAVYYLFCGIYLNKLGYTNPESLFYIEKARVIFDGLGNRIKVMGLTAPILPFYGTFIFFITCPIRLAPVIASSLGMAALFLLMARALLRRFNGDFYLFILVVVFLFHPGILYAACSGKGTYLVLISFFLFFLNILKFYKSNTTFHISVASICLVILVFCDYKFIWLSLFFIPLVLSIAIQSLNLSEKESIFRLFLSFNSPSLRRKLISKTFALYIIIFILPIAAITSYKLLNLTHANDLNYFIDSPYATWSVISDRMTYDQVAFNSQNAFFPQDVSLLISAKALIFCPMILVALYLFRESTYQVLTLLTPFAFIEFLHIKYDKIFLGYEYYMIFLILALLCLMFKAREIRHQKVLKVILAILVIVQIYTGYAYLNRSMIKDEKTFITMLLHRNNDYTQNDNRDVADYINGLPDNDNILVDDAIAYPVAAFINNTRRLTMPYQDEFASAIESPDKYDSYILIATAKNPATGYTQINDKYIIAIQTINSGLKFHKLYENDDWALYHILSN